MTVCGRLLDLVMHMLFGLLAAHHSICTAESCFFVSDLFGQYESCRCFGDPVAILVHSYALEYRLCAL